MKITKKELFKFCDENNDAINELQSQSDSTDFLLAVLIQQLKGSGVIDEISPEPKPQLKQLYQSVFDGLDEKWRFAAVVADGRAMYFNKRPYDASEEVGFFVFTGDYRSKFAGENYDTSNWQNSLIERDIVKELLEVDLSGELTGSELCKAMLARGDKYVMCLVNDDNNIQVISGWTWYGFTSTTNKYCLFKTPIPINNQGEPLTASEVGL